MLVHVYIATDSTNVSTCVPIYLMNVSLDHIDIIHCPKSQYVYIKSVIYYLMIIMLLSIKTWFLVYVLVYVSVELLFSVFYSERVSLNTYFEKNYYDIICFGDFSCTSIIDLIIYNALFERKTLHNINTCNIVPNI